jgi:hypothetical protein
MNTPKIIRDNIVLVAGIALPLVVMLLFLLATWIPGWLVDPPQHDLLISGVSWNDQSRDTANLIVTDDGRLKVRYFREAEGQSPKRQLFLFDHAANEVREILLPNPVEANFIDSEYEVSLPEFEARTVSTKRIAPDGYEFLGHQYVRDYFLGWGFGGRRSKLSIRKSGAVVAIPTLSSYPYYNGTEFVGWLID